MKFLIKNIKAMIVLISLFAGFVANAANTGPTIIKIAHSQNYVPYTFVNDKGESDGFEVQVLKAVNQLLPEYKFEFYPSSEEDILIGLDTGKYDAAVKGAWYTKKRAEKLIFPKHNIGASIIGLTFRASDKNKITDLKSFAKFSGKLVPIPPESAQWPIIEEFNTKNPATPIKLIPSEQFIVKDAYKWVLEGRYDGFFDLKVSFNKSVVNQDGAYHKLVNDLAFVPYLSIPTYPMFNKQQQQLADKFDKAIETLEKDGTLQKLSNQYFAENIFKYLAK